MSPKFNVKCKLTGTNGNCFAVMGTVKRAMLKAKVPQEDITAFMTEAMSGDYDHLLRTAMEYVEVV